MSHVSGLTGACPPRRPTVGRGCPAAPLRQLVPPRCWHLAAPGAGRPGARAVDHCPASLAQDPLLPDLGRLTDPSPQVVELGPADVTLDDGLDPGDDRRVDGERTFDTHPEADLADRERLPHAGALAADDRALEHMDALEIAFDDEDVDKDRVDGREEGGVVEKGTTIG